MVEKQTVTMGDTEVLITEENGVVTVKVGSENAVVYVGDQLVWSIGNEKEEFKRIPPMYHNFLLKNGIDFAEYDNKNQITTVDTNVGRANITIYFPINKKKDIHARFDFITGVEAVKEYIKELYEEGEEKAEKYIKELEDKFQSFKAFVEEKGFKLVYSHESGDWAYAWWDIVFDSFSWNEDNFVVVCKEIDAFDSFIRHLRDDLDI